MYLCTLITLAGGQVKKHTAWPAMLIRTHIFGVDRDVVSGLGIVLTLLQPALHRLTICNTTERRRRADRGRKATLVSERRSDAIATCTFTLRIKAWTNTHTHTHGTCTHFYLLDNGSLLHTRSCERHKCTYTLHAYHFHWPCLHGGAQTQTHMRMRTHQQVA